jgi:uncharacterized protein YjiS (DUF1127 family)
MTRLKLTKATPDQIALGMPGTFLGRPLERLLACVQEWRTRRNLKRSLGHLSSFYLRDVGLIKADVGAALADSFDRSATRALSGSAQSRFGNW